MNKMVMQLLSLSKLELGREQPSLADVELDELLARTLEAMRADEARVQEVCG